MFRRLGVLATTAILTALSFHAIPIGAATTCSTTLQSLIDQATPFSVVDVPACLYRETVTITKPLVLDGHSQAEIRGSDVWTNWTPNGATWLSINNVPQLGSETPYLSDGRCPSTTSYSCVNREQVFIDGQPLQEIGTGSIPAIGQFSLNTARQVVLADNPTAHVIEVTTRQGWVTTMSNGVTIRGFTMRHAASPAEVGGVGNNGFDDWTLSDNTLTSAHGEIVSIYNGQRAQVLRNDISGGGEAGIGGYSSNATLQGNHVHDNGTTFSNGWGGAGVKLSGQNITLNGNELDHNPFGAWADVGSNGWLVTANRVHDNDQGGIQFEISNGATIRGNAVWNNGWGRANWGWGAGIIVQTSGNAEVDHNTVAWNYAGISIVDLTRSDAPTTLNGTSVHDNVIVRQIANTSQFWANQQLFANDDQGGVTITANPPTFRGNLLWADRAEGWPPVLYTFGATAWPLLSDWSAHTSDVTSRYATNVEAYVALNSAGIPTGDIPTTPAPTPTSTATLIPTATVTRTATPMPTAIPTATPTPACFAFVRRGTRQWWAQQPDAFCGQ